MDAFKATKDIAAGQELFIRYGGAEWFQSKKIMRVDVDYASTMWQPDLHPLPCPREVGMEYGADGRRVFFTNEAVPRGTVLIVSLCLEVAVRVVDQLPFLWDFVLTGETGNEYTGCQQTSGSSHPNTACVFADQEGEGNIGEPAGRVSFFISALTLSQYPNP